MVYKKIGGDLTPEILEDIEKNGIILSCQDVGYQIEGVYDGFVEIVGYKGKGKQRRHTVETEGGTFMFRGFGLVDHILEKVDKGSQVKITYDGKTGDYHKCTVEVDDGEVVVEGEIAKATKVADANTKAAMIEKNFGDQAMPNADELEAMDFFEYMLFAKDKLKTSTGDHGLYNGELKRLYKVSFLSQVRGDTKKQEDIRSYFEGLLEEVLGDK